MSRRPATAEDMKIGALVFKGSGKVQYRVIDIQTVYDGSVRYVVQKVTSSGKTNRWPESLKYFTVEI